MHFPYAKNGHIFNKKNLKCYSSQNKGKPDHFNHFVYINTLSCKYLAMPYFFRRGSSIFTAEKVSFPQSLGFIQRIQITCT